MKKMKLVPLMAAAVLCATSVFGLTVDCKADTRTNVLLGTTEFSYPDWSDTDSIYYLFDGSYDMHADVGGSTVFEDEEREIKVDLGEVHKVDGWGLFQHEVLEGQGANYSVQNATLFVSTDSPNENWDNVTWTEVSAITDANTEENYERVADFDAVDARCVKIVFYKMEGGNMCATDNGIRPVEIEVYATDDDATTGDDNTTDDDDTKSGSNMTWVVIVCVVVVVAVVAVIVIKKRKK